MSRGECAAATPRLCAGCNRPFEVGDRYIVDTSSGFLGKDGNPEVDDIMAGIFGGSDSKLWLCEDCTEPGEGWLTETYYEEDE
jgi:hypothetical protein